MVQSLTQALRTMSRSPGLYALVALILGLGLAAVVATLSLADAVLLRPVPYPDGERLVTLYEQNLERQVEQMLLSYPNFEGLAANQSLADVAAYQATNSLTLAGPTETVRVQSNFVSERYLALLGAQPELGTPFDRAAHAGPMAQQTVVLSWGLWQSRFGGDPGVLGRAIELNGVPFDVVGVLQRDFVDLPAAGNPTEVWLPLETYPMLGFSWEVLQRRTTRFLAIVARLSDGLDHGQAQAEVQAYAARLQAEFPGSHGGYSIRLQSLVDFQAGPFRAGILALLGGAVFMLLIGCANASNLILVRATARQSEVAIHQALGAGRGQLAQRLMLEGLLLGAVGAAVGLALGQLALRGVLLLSPVSLPDYLVLETRFGVVGAVALVAVLAGLLIGAAQTVALSAQGMSQGLRASGRAKRGAGERWRRSLIGLEIACSVALLLGGLLLVQSFRNLAAQPIGFDSERLLTLRTTLPVAAYSDPEQQTAFVREARRELLAVPGVEDAIVWSRSMPSQATWYRAFAASGSVLASQNEAHASRIHFVSAGALEQLGVPLLRGRTLEATDDAAAEPVVVLSESAAAALFPGEDPLGRSVHRWNSPQSPEEETHYRVVGVVADARLAGRAQASLPTSDVYYAYAQAPSPELNLLLRTAGPPEAVADLTRARMRALDPTLPLYDVMSMRERMGLETEQSRFVALLAGTFALVAVLLAGLGLYSVLAFFMHTHVGEIGLRMALGSQRLGIAAWMVRQMLVVVGLGAAAGLAASVALARLLESSLFGVEALDPTRIAVVLLCTLGTALLGAFLPVLRASRVQPSVALRAQ